jgi:hypothetical protein
MWARTLSRAAPPLLLPARISGTSISVIIAAHHPQADAGTALRRARTTFTPTPSVSRSLAPVSASLVPPFDTPTHCRPHPNDNSGPPHRHSGSPNSGSGPPYRSSGDRYRSSVHPHRCSGPPHRYGSPYRSSGRPDCSSGRRYCSSARPYCSSGPVLQSRSPVSPFGTLSFGGNRT